MKISHKSSKKDRITAEIADANLEIKYLKQIYTKLAGENPSLDVSTNLTKEQLLAAIVELTNPTSAETETLNEDPTCTAQFNPTFSETTHDVLVYQDGPPRFTFNGINLGVVAGQIIHFPDYGSYGTVKTVTEDGTETMITVYEDRIDGCEDSAPVVFQNGFDIDGTTALGKLTMAVGRASHAIGYMTRAYGTYSHAEGSDSIASGRASHAEGESTFAIGLSSHAEGRETNASGQQAHAEGRLSVATGHYTHAQGYDTKAMGNYSHAEGNSTEVTGEAGHAEGFFSKAVGKASHAGGFSYNTLHRSEAEGESSFIHQQVDNAAGIKKAAGANSAILGGKNNSIASTALRSVVLGGTAQNATLPDAVYMHQLKLKPLSSLPTGLVAADAGLIVFDDVAKVFKGWSGTAWLTF